jgi:hypothetical protein
VEFAELSILQSGERTLAESKLLLLVESLSATLECDCCAFLRPLGYSKTVISKAWWRAMISKQRHLDYNR